MKIESVQLRKIELPLKTPFTTHHGRITKRTLIIVEIKDYHGLTGYGEVTAFDTPFYTSETIDTAWHMLRKVIIPLLQSSENHTPWNFVRLMTTIQGHPMARAGVEGALWDLYGKQRSESLSSILGGTREHVKAGAVLSLSDNIKKDLNSLKEDGYERYKLKIAKGHERKIIETVRELEPNLPIMIDANGQYGEEDIGFLKSIDPYGLMMIEQPFPAGDFYLHRELQEGLKTAVCLDESVMSYHDAVQAVLFKACQVINIKISRVGGLTAAKAIHDFCQRKGVSVWCGGMVESGISKAHNLALASLPNFTIPGDLSSSTRYFERDVITPGIEMRSGNIKVPQGSGIGVEVDKEYLEKVTKDYYQINFR